MKKPKIDSLFMAAGGSGDSSPISLLRTLRGFAQPSTSLAGRGKRPSPPCFPFSVISPRGGELNTSGAERRSELTSPGGANQKGKKPLLSQGAERLFMSQIGFSAPCQGSQHVKYRLRTCVAQPVTSATSGF